MSIFPCSLKSCQAKSIPLDGDCAACGRHLCAKHLAAPYHRCLAFTDEQRDNASFTIERQQTSSILRILRASTVVDQANILRPGHTATLMIPKDAEEAVMGCQNVHVPITFEDNVNWLVRVRQRGVFHHTKEIRQMSIESEVETMKVLKSIKTGLIPDAWMPPVETSGSAMAKNIYDRDQEYFFVEAMSGSAARKFVYQDPIMLRNTIFDYAAFSIKLSELTFDGIGSLYPSGGSASRIGPMITPLSVVLPDPPYFLGPFNTQKDRYILSIDHYLDSIERGECCISNPIEAYVWHLELRDMVLGCEPLSRREDKHYLKHADDKGDHYLVDADGHLNAIIDWEWAYTTTKSEAFCAPAAFISTQGVTARLSPFEEILASAYDELGHPDLAECVRSPMRNIHRLLNIAIGRSPHVGIHRLLCRTLEEIADYSSKNSGDQGENLQVNRESHHVAPTINTNDQNTIQDLDNRIEEDQEKLEKLQQEARLDRKKHEATGVQDDLVIRQERGARIRELIVKLAEYKAEKAKIALEQWFKEAKPRFDDNEGLKRLMARVEAQN